MATSPRPSDPEPTAAWLLDNARGILPSPLAHDERAAPDHHLHMVAVAVELALKAALLAAGSSDYSNRVFIGHDLAEAADQAADRGLAVPRPMRALIAVLHPYYMDGGFHRGRRRSWPRIATRARAIAADLIGRVDLAMKAGKLSPRSGPPRAGLASTVAVLAIAVCLPSVRAIFFARDVAFAPRDRWFVRSIRRLPIASRGVYLMSCRTRLGYRTIARLTFMPVRRVEAHIAGSLLALRHDHIAAGEPSCER